LETLFTHITTKIGIPTISAADTIVFGPREDLDLFFVAMLATGGDCGCGGGDGKLIVC
jgi:hypothetical protein